MEIYPATGATGGTLRLLVLSTETTTRNHYILLAITAALRNHPEVAVAHTATIWDAARLVTEHACNGVIVVGAAGNNASVVERVVRMVTYSALWTTEDPYDLPRNWPAARYFQHVFTNDRASVAAYGGHARHLPLAGSVLFNSLKPLERDADFRHDLLFVGTGWPNRVADLNRIIARLPASLSMKIALAPNPFIPKPELIRGDLVTDWRCSNVDLARLANRSRVTLTLDRTFSSTEGAGEAGSTPPPRVFEVALAGGYQVYLSGRSEIDQYFDIPQDIRVSGTPDAVASDILQALNRPEERIKSAISARERALREHTYEHRTRHIIDQFLSTPLNTPLARKPRAAVNVLLVAHNQHGYKPGGGVEVYLEHFMNLGPEYAIHRLFPFEDNAQHFYRVVDGRGAVVDYPLAARSGEHALFDTEREQVFARIMDEYHIGLVHFHHLIGHPLSLPLLAAAYGVPVLWTLHDYFLICERFNLLDYQGKYCDIASKSPTQCDICLSATNGLPVGAQTRRRNFVAGLIPHIDCFIYNTEFSRDYVQRLYPEIKPARTRVIEMMLPAPRAATRPVSTSQRASQRTPGKLRVAIPGNFTKEKGGDDVLRLMNMMRDDPVTFTIIGTVRPELQAGLKALNLASVTTIGEYNFRLAVSLLADHDVSLHLSIWPETYLISLSECWAAGVVPIVYGLGAPAGRVTPGKDGFVVPPGDIGAVIEHIRMLVHDPEQLDTLRDEVRKRPVTGVREHFHEIRTLYDALIAARPALPHDAKPSILTRSSRIEGAELYRRADSPFWHLADNRWDSDLSVPGQPPPTRWLAQLPAARRTLPTRVFQEDLVADTIFHIDRVEADATRISLTARAVRAAREVVIQGWAFTYGEGPPRGAYLRFQSEHWTRFIEAHLAERPDVREALGDENCSSAGFYVKAIISELIPATYRVTLVQIYDQRAVLFPFGFDLTIINPFESPAVLTIDALSGDTNAMPGPGTSLEEAMGNDESLTDDGDMALASPGQKKNRRKARHV